MKKKYGCNLKKIDVGSSWDVYVILNAKIEEASSLYNIMLQLEAEKVFSVKDKKKWEEEDINTKKNVINDDVIESITNKKITDSIDKKLEIFSDKFFKYPIGTIVTYILDEAIIPVLGDLPQFLASAITFSDTTLTYKKTEIETNTYLDKYINVGEYVPEDTKYKYQVDIKSVGDEKIEEDEDLSQYPKKTKIPLIEAELYNMATNNIDMLNINFFESNLDVTDSPWEYLRVFTSNVIHIAIYVGIAFLITTLIYHGVQIVRTSITNPVAKKEHMQGIKKFALSTLMIVGTVLIMSLTIYSVRMILNGVFIENSKEFPIRVHIEEAGYSFSTNITGFFKYMSQIKSIYCWTTKSIYAFAYIVLAWVNLFMSILMICRMIILLVLSILGAIIATLYAINVEWPMPYKIWIKIYISFSIIQIFIAIAYRLFLLAFR